MPMTGFENPNSHSSRRGLCWQYLLLKVGRGRSQTGIRSWSTLSPVGRTCSCTRGKRSGNRGRRWSRKSSRRGQWDLRESSGETSSYPGLYHANAFDRGLRAGPIDVEVGTWNSTFELARSGRYKLKPLGSKLETTIRHVERLGGAIESVDLYDLGTIPDVLMGFHSALVPMHEEEVGIRFMINRSL